MPSISSRAASYAKDQVNQLSVFGVGSMIVLNRRSARQLYNSWCCTVKSRYPCSGLAPVAVFHWGDGLGGVGS